MLTKEELLLVRGGSFSAIVSALTKAATTILNIGQIVGSAIRRAITKTPCSLN